MPDSQFIVLPQGLLLVTEEESVLVQPVLNGTVDSVQCEVYIVTFTVYSALECKSYTLQFSVQ